MLFLNFSLVLGFISFPFLVSRIAATELFGLKNLQIRLPCAPLPSIIKPIIQIHWSRCFSCGDHWTNFAIVDIINKGTTHRKGYYLVPGGRAKIDLSNGDLIIDNLEIDDEGLYLCRPTGSHGAIVQLDIYGMYGFYSLLEK